MLGFILSPFGQIPGGYPNEIGYTGAATGGPWLCPPDPQYNTHGEASLYHDTQLGGLGLPAQEGVATMLLAALATLSPAQRARAVRSAIAARAKAGGSGMRGIPTDAELATAYGYTPFASGWVAAKEGDYTSNWVPPNGWDPAGTYGPRVAASALRGNTGSAQIADVPIPAAATTSETQAIVDTLNAQSDRSFKLAIITTVVIGTAAIVNSYRVWKQLHRDEMLLQRKLAA